MRPACPAQGVRAPSTPLGYMYIMVEVMITPGSVGAAFFLRDRRYHAHFLVVVIAYALTVSFFTTFEHLQAPWGRILCPFLLILYPAQNVVL